MVSCFDFPLNQSIDFGESMSAMGELWKCHEDCHEIPPKKRMPKSVKPGEFDEI